ncbi:hypothetical protein GIB67_007381 [Kingdonia uniflora]|uniref:Uncharacterized protein n=1 Tax=Kingdonia uniflora TaxID=39325 RepID=A0A7J7NXQ1_9MAGN|nr:hypothetical protein GIB67_007381 [Kingdonia uniflora]
MGLFSLDNYTDQFYLIEARAKLHEIEQQRLAKQANELHAQYRPPVQTTTTIALAISTVTASRTFILGHCYGCGKPGHQKCGRPAFSKRVSLVVDGMCESVITTVQRIRPDEDEEETEMHTTFVPYALLEKIMWVISSFTFLVSRQLVLLDCLTTIASWNADGILMIPTISDVSTVAEWRLVAKDIVQRDGNVNWRTIIVDWPGLGYSDRPKIDYNAEVMEKFLVDFINAADGPLQQSGE